MNQLGKMFVKAQTPFAWICGGFVVQLYDKKYDKSETNRKSAENRQQIP